MITIGFTKPKNRTPIIGYALSFLIRLVERTEFSHVYISWYSEGIDRNLYYEASGSSVKFVNQEYMDLYTEIVAKFEIPTTLKHVIIQKCVDNVNKKYGIMELIGLGLVKLVKIFGKDVKNPFSNQNTYFCSELIADLIKELGITFNKDLNLVTPKDIYIKLQNYRF